MIQKQYLTVLCSHDNVMTDGAAWRVHEYIRNTPTKLRYSKHYTIYLKLTKEQKPKQRKSEHKQSTDSSKVCSLSELYIVSHILLSSLSMFYSLFCHPETKLLESKCHRNIHYVSGLCRIRHQ